MLGRRRGCPFRGTESCLYHDVHQYKINRRGMSICGWIVWLERMTIQTESKDQPCNTVLEIYSDDVMHIFFDALGRA